MRRTDSIVQVLTQAAFNFPEDRRQSEMARTLARGTRRLLRAHGYSTVTELGLANGRRADIVALGTDGTFVIVEVKSSVADYRADAKWQFYRAFCDRLLFSIPTTIPADLISAEAGLIVADAYGGEIVREPVEHRLSSATRRAMFIRFAQAAADRLHRLADAELDL